MQTTSNLSDLAGSYIREVCAGKLNQTPAAYRSKLKHLIEFCHGGQPISQELINAFRQYLLDRNAKRLGGKIIQAHLSPFTVRSILQTVRQFLRWGQMRGYWNQIELKNVQEPQPQPKAIKQKTFEQLVRAARITGAAWEQARNTAILFVLRDSGCRVGAVASIDVSDVDLERGVMSAMDKGGRLSWIYMSASTTAAVRAWLGMRSELEPRDYKLWTGQRHLGITRIGIYHMIRRMAKVAGLVGVRCNPHSFRHAFARDALLAGADLSQVSQLLNHKSIGVTAKYYARWNDQELRKVHKRVSPMRDKPAKP